MILKEMETSNTYWKDKVTEVRKTLRSASLFQYLNTFLDEYPEYNTHSGINRVRNVMQGLIVDKDLILKLEQFANKKLTEFKKLEKSHNHVN